MEGESSQNNNIPLRLISSNFLGNNGGNDVPNGPEDNQNGNLLMGTGGRSWNQTDVVRLPWWVQVQPQDTSQNYVQFLAESSGFHQRTSSDDMLGSLSLPDNATPYAVSGVSDFTRDMSYNHMGLACGSKSTDMDANCKLRAPLMPHNEDLKNKFSSTQHHIHPQNITSWTKNSNGESFYCQDDIQSARVASPGSLSQHQSTVPTQRNYSNDRQRRIRCADGLNALQELLPNYAKGCQGSVLDDVIDHINYLKLQIKDLSKSRLGGELPTKPIIFREGFGHYFWDQQMSTEPLEEMLVKLLEQNPLVASELLEMKGLLLMPIELTEGLA